ncbi:MAG: CapA family protein [Bacteroidales bacterium]|nr:CapA family protein [Bacteroidales bacterium]
MNKLVVFFFVLLLGVNSVSAQSDTLRFLFVGDVMGHDSQINAAYNYKTGKYNYDTCFSYVSPIFKKHDFVVANLEVTLNCKPYSGYPAFSSPAELPAAMIKAGVNVFVTANNHSADRGYNGVVKTVKALDSLNVLHTGTFINTEDKKKNNPLILTKNGFSIALLNYTYGLNGIPIPSGTFINMLDTNTIKTDIDYCKNLNIDKIIAFVHWGNEYETAPNLSQKRVAGFFKRNGVEIVIGSHPHVVQPSYFENDITNENQSLVVYSLGNFISNQRTQPRDGGQMIQLTLVKNNGKIKIENVSNYLTWVHAPYFKEKKYFFVLPVAQFETNPDFLLG